MIDRIKANIDLRSEIEKTHDINSSNQIICPFKAESQPSFTVYDDRYYCFSCGESGDVIDWVAHQQNLSPDQAISQLAGQAGIPFTPEVPDPACDLIEQYVVSSHYRLVQSGNDYAASLYPNNVIGKWGVGLGTKPTAQQQAIGITGGFEGRIVYPVKQGNRYVNLIGRWAGQPPEGVTKTINMKGRPVVPFNSHRLYGQSVTVVEGPKDCIVLEEQGYPATALVGLNLQKWDTGEDTEVRLCFDADTPNIPTTTKHGSRLYAKKRRVYVIQLPAGSDPADVGAEFPLYYEAATPFIKWHIDQFDWGGNDGYELSDTLKLIMGLIAKGADSEWAVRYLKEVTGFTNKVLNEALSEAPSDDMELIWEEDDPQFFRPAQHWDHKQQQLTYTVRAKVANGLYPFLLSSEKELVPFSTEDLVGRGYIYRGDMPSGMVLPRWSIGTKHEHGIHDFLNGAQPVSSLSVFEQIKALFDRYILYPDPLYSSVLALWVMNTYVYVLYDHTPYLWLHAMKQSGKTNTLLLLDALSFNAWFTTLITESALSRALAVDQSTLIIDEAEYYREGTASDNILSALKGGYKANANASKSVKNEAGNWESGQFPSYTPKAFGSIKKIDNVLADRCITLHLQRVTKDIEALDTTKAQPALTRIRNQLYCWGMNNVHTLANADPIILDGLTARLREIWTPLMQIAKLVNDGLLSQIIDIFYERKAYKQHQDDDENEEKNTFHAIIQCMKHFRHWEKSDPKARDWYPTSDIIGYARDEFGRDFNPRQLGSIIFDLLQIASREKDQKRLTIDGKHARSVKLRRGVIEGKAKQMFDMDIDWEEPVEVFEDGTYIEF